MVQQDQQWLQSAHAQRSVSFTIRQVLDLETQLVCGARVSFTPEDSSPDSPPPEAAPAQPDWAAHARRFAAALTVWTHLGGRGQLTIDAPTELLLVPGAARLLREALLEADAPLGRVMLALDERHLCHEDLPLIAALKAQGFALALISSEEPRIVLGQQWCLLLDEVWVCLDVCGPFADLTGTMSPAERRILAAQGAGLVTVATGKADPRALVLRGFHRLEAAA